MSKKLFSLLIAILVAHGIFAQNSMSVPNGCFEQWSSHPGYSVNTGFMTLPVYNDFSTPTGWNHLSYPVNESISMGFTTINVNTDLPLILVTPETGSVPEGNYAVKLQTFMLGDIVNSTVYALASGYLDTTLTNTVYPSILSTGEVNIEHFIPIMNSLISNMDNIESLLVSLLDLDVNYLVTGGVALGDFSPTGLRGLYKYNSATSGDNGGVLILGTHYNTALHKREVVGGGVNINLTDCTDYTSFEVPYISLHDYDAGYPEVAPDSVIVLLVSSANMNRQQGSCIFFDSLRLIHIEPPLPDTCADIVTLSVLPAIHEAAISWNCSDQVQGFELEYGSAGFAQGTGTLVSPLGDSYLIEGLDANTQYDIWVRSVCSNDVYGDWMMTSFSTIEDTCARITSVQLDESNLCFTADHLVSGYYASWQSSFTPYMWEVEFGIEGFEPGTGISDMLSDYFTSYTMGGLQPDMQYEFRVRAVCDEEIYGEWESILFHTPEYVGIDAAYETGISLTPNPACGQCVVELHDFQAAELRLYSSDGRLLQTVKNPSSSETILLPSQGLFLLQLVTEGGSVTHKIVNK